MKLRTSCWLCDASKMYDFMKTKTTYDELTNLVYKFDKSTYVKLSVSPAS